MTFNQVFSHFTLISADAEYGLDPIEFNLTDSPISQYETDCEYIYTVKELTVFPEATSFLTKFLQEQENMDFFFKAWEEYEDFEEAIALCYFADDYESRDLNRYQITKYDTAEDMLDFVIESYDAKIPNFIYDAVRNSPEALTKIVRDWIIGSGDERYIFDRVGSPSDFDEIEKAIKWDRPLFHVIYG